MILTKIARFTIHAQPFGLLEENAPIQIQPVWRGEMPVDETTAQPLCPFHCEPIQGQPSA